MKNIFSLYDRAYACTSVVNALRQATDKAGVDFVKFMADKWHVFKDSDDMVYHQQVSCAELLDMFCYGSTTEETVKVMSIKEQLEDVYG